MKTIWGIAVAVCMLTIACSENKDKEIGEPAGSRAFVLSDVNSRANISMYEYPAKKLTDLYAVDGEFNSPMIAANKNGESAYIITVHPATLRRVDLKSGSELKSITTSTLYDQQIAFHGKDVIFCHLHLDGPDPVSVLKIFDENLEMKDSIAFEVGLGLKAAAVMNDRLFISLYGEDGAYLEVFDFSTDAFLDPIVLPHIGWQLLPLDNNRLMTILSDKYYMVDTQTLQLSEPVTAYIGKNPAAYNQSSKKLIWLRSLAQPALRPYSLHTMDLATGESSALEDDGESIVGPLVFDPNSKLILSGPGIKTFSMEGKLLDKIETSSTTKYIFLQ